MIQIRELQQRCLQFLQRLFEEKIRSGKSLQSIYAYKLGEELDFDKKVTDQVVTYLEEKQLIELVEMPMRYGITREGLKYVEERINMNFNQIEVFNQKFSNEHNPQKTVFVMMKFSGEDPENDKKIENLFDTIKLALDKYSLGAVRADEKNYSDTDYLWDNVQIYLNGCDYGIAILENLYSDEMNPNVALEYGYMLAKGKRLLLLKERSFKNIRADILGKMWKEFEIDKKESIEKAIQNWMVDLGLTRIKA